jgi:predicted acylesterase/phospholipase RssA
MKRRTFLAGSATAALAATSPAIAGPNLRTGRKALVLVGGVNRGAYQAGVIQALVEKAGLHDGQALDFDMVCGTSIGALNGYLVSTAQYSLMKSLWLGGISSQNIFRLKPPFNKIKNVDSGLVNRLGAAFSLGNGLNTNVAGILDPAPVHEMLERYVSPSAAVHIPAYIATTNLSRQRGEIFVRRATTPEGALKQAANDALLAGFPVQPVLATDAILPKVYFATACLPLAFDPIEIPRADGSGKIDQFVDGGVTANAPINIAQLCTDSLHVVLVDPKQSPPDVHYNNAFEVGLGVFETMQSRMLLYQVILAYAAGKASLPFSPYIMRPGSVLPGKVGDFNDQRSLTASWQTGYDQGQIGFEKFEFPIAGMLAPFDRTSESDR